MRVVRFYQSCSSPLPPPSPPPPRLAILLLLLFLLLLLLLRLFLLDHVCINFHLNFRLANSWPSSLPTSQLSVHHQGPVWTPTGDLQSSVCTAGPQPGTFPAQCALLDLNGQIECQKIYQIECQIECQKICQIKCHEICQIECQEICQIKC